MTSLRKGDEYLHHCDGSHRWSGGPADKRGQEAYQQTLRAHLAEHRRIGAGPPKRTTARPSVQQRSTATPATAPHHERREHSG